jgi:PAS domain S-box-containing protein
MHSYVWRILLVDEDEDDYFLTREMLADTRRGRFILEWASTYETGVQALQESIYDAALVDYDLGECNGIELIRAVRGAGITMPVILFTARANYEVDVLAMEAGASDFLDRAEVNSALLERTIRYAIERQRDAEALRVSEEKFRLLVENSIDGIALVNEHGIVVEWNRGREQMTGLRREEVVGCPAWEVVNQLLPDTFSLEQREALREEIEQMLKTGQAAKNGLSHGVSYSLDRGEHKIETVVFPIPTSDGFMLGSISRDITEVEIAHRQVEVMARISEENPNPVMRIDQSGLLLYANPACAVMLEDWGCQVGHHIPYEWQEYVSEALESGQKQEVEIMVRGQCFASLLAPVQPGGYVNLYASDVTDHYRLLEENEQNHLALERQKELLEQVVENSPISIVLLDGPEHRYALCNPAHTIVARGKGPLLGRKFSDIWPEEDGILEEVYRSGQSRVFVDVPVHIMRESGEENAFFTISLTPLFDAHHQPESILIMGMETTEQVRMRQQIDAERARLMAVIQNAPEGILVVDREGNVILGNPAIEKIFMKSFVPGENFACQPSPLMYPDGSHYDPKDIPLNRTIREGASFHEIEMCLEGPDGELITLLANTSPILDKDGQVQGGVAMLSDISRRRHARLNLEQELAERRLSERMLLSSNDALAESNAALQKSEERFRVCTGRSAYFGVYHGSRSALYLGI